MREGTQLHSAPKIATDSDGRHRGKYIQLFLELIRRHRKLTVENK